MEIRSHKEIKMKKMPLDRLIDPTHIIEIVMLQKIVQNFIDPELPEAIKELSALAIELALTEHAKSSPIEN